MSWLFTNNRDMPPLGFLYREPSIGWEADQSLALQGLDRVARELQQARKNNPISGLDTSYEAAVEAIKAYTCARLPAELRGKWCQQAGEEALAKVAAVAAKKKPGCATCGGRRR